MRIAVLGAGAWGTALGLSLCASHEVTVWVRNSEQFISMSETRQNTRYLPGLALSTNLVLSNQLEATISERDLLFLAVPTAGLRSTMRQLKVLGVACPVVWLSKGFEAESSKLPHQIAQEELGLEYIAGILSGPSFAEEVARGQPTALTLASNDFTFAQHAAQYLHHAKLRVYSSSDISGVEIAGALKNVIAIAVGICDGLNLGYNARAALITRGLAEITRLGTKLGGRQETFMGLAGVGDLILTCTGDLSRNRTVGLKLSKNQALQSILAELGHVAEGVYTVREAKRLSELHNIEMPITDAVYELLYGNSPAQTVIERLLNRDVKAEHQ